MHVYCMERKINSRTNDSLIESSHTATRLDFFGFYMLKARGVLHSLLQAQNKK